MASTRHTIHANTDASDELEADRMANLDSVCAKAREASEIMRGFDQEQVDRIVWAMTRAALKNVGQFAKEAIDETGIGIFEDKVLKNYVATEFLYDYLRDKKSVGVIEVDRARNVRKIAEPIGVVLAIMPITNPTSTVIFKTIVAAKTRNAMIVRPSSRAYKCAAECVRVVVEAGIEAGLPPGAIQCLDLPTHNDTQYLFKHKEIDLIWTTGGQKIVNAANASGKPTIGVGPGNAPVYLNETCDIKMAVVDILTSKTFDASVICPAEQTLVIDDAIYDETMAEFVRMGARLLTVDEADRLTDVCFDRASGDINISAVGKSIRELGERANISVQPTDKVFLAQIDEFDAHELLLHEKLFPVLAILKSKNQHDAIDLCDRVTQLGGLGHTSAVYSRDETVIDQFSLKIRAGRILVNAPTSFGALGGIYTDLPPTFSLGCGTWGGSTTTDNVNYENLLNIKQVSYRKSPSMWFRAPVDIYYNEHAVDNLRQFTAVRTAIIASPGSIHRGVMDKVIESLDPDTSVDTFTSIGPEPTEKEIERGVAFLNELKPDLIVAVGGGSVIDAAKLMRLLYENPGIDWRELALPFMDVRKRATKYPPRRQDMKLVAIPTTSGTGSEVSPVAVVTDSKTGRKVTLVDYTLVPEVAIVDPQLVVSMPKGLTAESGVDALTHSLEALVSVFSSPYTEALCMQSFHLLSKYLPMAYNDPFDIVARGKVHNASTIAGLAFSNAFVGVGHALAHALGATFGISHGKACGLFIPHVMQYNSSLPTKFNQAPGYTAYVAPEAYARLAVALGLGGDLENKMDVAREALFSVVNNLLDAVEIPKSIAALGIKEEEFREKIPTLVQLAYEDLSLRTNPRMPMLVELEELFWKAWDGRP